MMSLQVGQEIPELVKHPTTRQLVQYAGAQGDFYEILKAAFLGQLISDWLEERGRLKTFEVSYRGIDMPGQPYRCRGRVTKVEGDEVEIEVWGEDEDGKRTTLGSATVQMGA